MSLRNRLAGVSTAVGVLVGGLAIVFVGRLLARDWSEVREGLEGANPVWLVAAVLLAAGGMTSIAAAWRRTLRVLGGNLDWRQTLARYYVGELAKYVPGGVWPVLGRGELASRAGVPRLAAYGSVALSLASLYLAAMFLALAALPAMLDGSETGSGDEASAAVWVFLLLPLGVLGLHHAVLERVRGLGERLLGRRMDLPIPRWRESLLLLVCYVPAWLFIGAATWAVAQSMGQEASVWEVAPAAILSWIVGFVLVPVPGGLGVREVVFVAASGLAAGPAAAVAVVARVLFVLVDSVGALVASAWLARQRATDLRGNGRVAAEQLP